LSNSMKIKKQIRKNSYYFFSKAVIPRSTLYRVLKKYIDFGTATFFHKIQLPSEI